jgi:chaperonin GroEL
VAVVRVGASTELEMKELKARVEDALHATKAAIEEGVVPGGGTALLRTQKAVDKLVKSLEGDVRTGASIIRRVLEEPMRMIAQNAGFDGAVIIEKVRSETNVATGFNADEEKVEDLVQAGVIDPTKVVRVGLQNAASISGLLLTTEALISELPEKKKAGPPMGGGGGGGGYEDFD